MVERVGLVTGGLEGVLGGEGEDDLPEKKDRSCGHQIGIKAFRGGATFILPLAYMLFSAKN